MPAKLLDKMDQNGNWAQYAWQIRKIVLTSRGNSFLKAEDIDLIRRQLEEQCRRYAPRPSAEPREIASGAATASGARMTQKVFQAEFTEF